jgi:hypothetical protein
MQTNGKSGGIKYFSLEGAPGEFFNCQPYRAKLSAAACARRWREAQTTTGREAYRIEKCRGCAVGACHAGEEIVEYSTLYENDICPRCGVGTTRMICGTRCISCYNREREFIKGRNARGTKPKMAPLERRTVRYAVAGGPIESVTIDHSADLPELMIVALRRTRGRIMFHFNGGQPVSQTETLS